MATSSKSFKQAVDDGLSGLSMTPEMKAKVLAAVQTTHAKPRRRAVRFRRAAVSMVAASLALVFGVAVAAAAFPSFERFLGNMGEDLRGLVQPVGTEVTAEGIRMEVVAAVHDGDSAVVYLTLQDKTGRRVDETTELASVNIGGAAFSAGEQMHFDPTDNTATFRLEGSVAGEELGRNITVELGSILSGRVYHEAVDTGLTLADIETLNPAPGTVALAAESDAYYSYSTAGLHSEALEALLASRTMPMLPLDSLENAPAGPEWVQYTGLGIVDGYLHVQRCNEPRARLSYPTFSLSYPGQEEEDTLSRGHVDRGETYEEFIYTYATRVEHLLEIPAGVPREQVRLMASGSEHSNYTEGPWKVSFPLEKDPVEKRAVCEIDLGGWAIHEVGVTSIGVAAYASGEMGPQSSAADIRVYLRDGSNVEMSSASTTAFGDESLTLCSNFVRPVAVEEIAKVVVNGTEIVFDD